MTEGIEKEARERFEAFWATKVWANEPSTLEHTYLPDVVAWREFVKEACLQTWMAAFAQSCVERELTDKLMKCESNSTIPVGADGLVPSTGAQVGAESQRIGNPQSTLKVSVPALSIAQELGLDELDLAEMECEAETDSTIGKVWTALLLARLTIAKLESPVERESKEPYEYLGICDDEDSLHNESVLCRNFVPNLSEPFRHGNKAESPVDRAVGERTEAKTYEEWRDGLHCAFPSDETWMKLAYEAGQNSADSGTE